MFTRLFEQGIAYRRESEVNWDPVDQTVLANEQVIDGRGWRSGAVVERRKIPQWFLRITDYCEELLDELDNIDLARAGQDHAAQLDRSLRGHGDRFRDRGPRSRRPGSSTASGPASRETGDSAADGLEAPRAGAGDAHPPLRIFTTRPDTVYGATFMAVATEHPLAAKVAERRDDVAAFIEECRRGGTSAAELETVEKRGMPLGLHADQPVQRRAPAGVGRELRAHGLRHRRRHVRARPRRARPRVRAPVRTSDSPGHRPRRRHRGGHSHDRVDRQGERGRRQLRGVLGARVPRVLRPHGALAGADRPRRAPGQLPAPRLGRLAPALLGLPGPHRALRRLRDGSGARRPAPGGASGGRGHRGRRLAPRPPPGVRADQLPGSAEPTRGATPTPSTPSWNRRGTSRASHARMPAHPSSTSAPTTGCPSTSTSGASSTPSFT